jgi:hypothetical protein
MKQLVRPIVGAFATFTLIAFLAACSTVAVNQRVAYWQGETERYLSSSSTLAQAEEFFVARGLKLVCCVSQPPGPAHHYALERSVGQLLWTEYHVAVLVELTDTQRVRSVRVERWGIGL